MMLMPLPSESRLQYGSVMPIRPLVLILTEIELQCCELFLEKKFAKEMDSVGKGRGGA